MFCVRVVWCGTCTFTRLFTADEINAIGNTTLYDLILRNTGIPATAIQRDVFHHLSRRGTFDVCASYFCCRMRISTVRHV